MLTQFRTHYPTGSLITELLQIHEGSYIVRALVQVGGVTLATGMASAATVEQAEDNARQRVLAVFGFQVAATPPAPVNPVEVAPVTAAQPVPNSPPLPEPEPPVKASVSVPAPTPSKTRKSKSPALESPLTPGNGSNSEPSGGMFSPVYSSVEPSREPLPEEEPWAVSYPAPEPELEAAIPAAEPSPETEVLDWSDLSMRVGVELQRLGWSKDQEDDYLKFAYGKSRTLLSELELMEFLRYLQAFTDASKELERLGWSQQQGRDYLKKTYPGSKGSRQRLSCSEIESFLDYLKSQPLSDQTLY